MPRFLLLVLLTFGVTACAQVPREQLVAFRAQFDAVHELSQHVADENRRMSRQLKEGEAGLERPRYDANGLPIFYADEVLARRGYVETYAAIWMVLESYLHVLEDLAESKPKDDLSRSLDNMMQSVLSVAETALSAYGAGGLVEPFRALVDAILKAQAAERFRVAVQGAQPILEQLIEGLIEDSETYAKLRNDLAAECQGERTVPIGVVVSGAADLLDARAVKRAEVDNALADEFHAASGNLVIRLKEMPVGEQALLGLTRLEASLLRFERGEARPPLEDLDAEKARKPVVDGILSPDDVTRMQVLLLRVEPHISEAIRDYARVLAHQQLLTSYVEGLHELARAHAALETASRERTMPDLRVVIDQVSRMREAWVNYANR